MIDEIDVLKSLLAEAQRESARAIVALENERAAKQILAHEHQSLKRDYDYLKALVERLKRGHQSEKFDPDQLELFSEADAQITAIAEEASDDEEVISTSVRQRKKRAKGREVIPAHIERRDVIHDVSDEDRHCATCNNLPMEEIGEDITEELEHQPERFFVTRHRRKKYACRCCQRNVVTAELPGRVVPKGIPAASLVAHVVTAKYADHLPLHRQEGIIARSGVEISRKTMCDWIARAAVILYPIVQELHRLILLSHCVRMDATGLKILAPVKTIAANLWAYLKKNEIVVYDFTIQHNKEGPEAFLGDYRGSVQADADPIYDPLFKSNSNLIEVACHVHCRRRFFEALSTDGVRASEVLSLYRRLYAIEANLKIDGASASARRVVRQELSKPIMDELFAWLQENKTTVLPKSPIGDAVRYAIRHWAALSRFVDDGELEIDNNDTERALRHVAVGRKNWLFAGSAEGGRRAATIYSVVMTCKLNGIDPHAYLREVLAELAANPKADVRMLTPMAWKARRSVPSGD